MVRAVLYKCNSHDLTGIPAKTDIHLINEQSIGNPKPYGVVMSMSS